MMSSRLGDQADSGKHGDGNVEDEGLCMGNDSGRPMEQRHSMFNDDISGAGPNVVSFNWQPFLDSCAGKVPNSSGPKCNKEVSGGSPTFAVDSADRGRPKKRNRPPMEESSDPFSLDILIENMNNNKGCVGSVIHPVSTVNLNHPLNSDGVPIIDEVETYEGESTQLRGSSVAGSKDPAQSGADCGFLDSGDPVEW
ncbi:hypothetical protein Hanom_Chr03g00221491 [Helianthus anomalus]